MTYPLTIHINIIPSIPFGPTTTSLQKVHISIIYKLLYIRCLELGHYA